MIKNSDITTSRKRVFQTLFRTAFFMLAIFVVFIIYLNINQRHGKDLALNETQALDLSAWEFSSQGMNFLESGWQFYPDQLLVPDDFQQNNPASEDALPRYDNSSRPHFSNVTITKQGWKDRGILVTSNSEALSASDIDGYGYGTYRIVLKVSHAERILAVDFPEINQAANIWVNGSLVKSLGAVSDSEKGIVVQEASANLKVMPNSAGIIEIVISCANYASPYGGIAWTPAIGTIAQIDNLNIVSKMWITSVFTLLILVVITGFYVSFTFEKRRKYYYFILIISMSLAYEFCDKTFNPLPGNWNLLLQTTFFLLMTLIATVHFSTLFPKDPKNFFDRLHYWDVHIIFAVICFFLIIFWLFPEYLYNVTFIPVCSVFIAVVNFYNVVRIFYTTVKNSEYGSFHLMSAITAMVVFSSMQLRTQQIYLIPLHSIGIMLMIFSAAIYFTIRYVNAYTQVSRFTLELEQAVQEKTRNIAKVNAELLLANQKLLENEEARKRMMSNVSHDLRTPIAAIRGYIELLLNSRSKITEETHDQYLKNMHTRSIQMEQMIDDLVQLTRLESGGIILNTQTLSMNHVIENLFELYETECRSTGKTISMELPSDDLLNVIGDPNHLIRVLDNLIVNAMRYTYAKGHIDIKAFREKIPGGENIHIIVSDDGSGIPASEISYVFDRFYRASNSASQKNGSGLGLAIVKSIIEKHGGKVWVESVENHGSTFHVIIPATKKTMTA